MIFDSYSPGCSKDGPTFDSSVDRGTPFPFVLDWGRDCGWAKGLAGIIVGEKRKLHQPAYAYVKEVFWVIPPNTTLIFEVELLEIN